MNKTVSRVIRSLEGSPITVKLVKKLSLPRDVGETRFNMQGGGTDGKYGYFIMVTRGPSETAMSYIHKVDLTTWQVLRVSRPLPLNHANDLCYDPKHHRLVISHCDIYPDRVSFVDPDTLELLEQRTIPQPHYSMAFCPEKGLYVAGKSRTYDFVLLDEDFQPQRLLPGEDGHVKQGLECDEDYIYFFQTGIRNNWIFLFDWDGNFLRKIPVPMVGESENLFVWGDRFIGAFNNNEERTGDIYEMILTGSQPEGIYYVNQLGYPHIRYEHNVANGGVRPERRNVATSGCGLCSACMVVGNLTPVRPTVEEMVKLTLECGANERVGSRLRILGPAIAEKYGLLYDYTNDPEEMLRCLDEGGIVVANVAGNREGYRALFSDIGHYVVILGREGRELCVADPAYRFDKYQAEERLSRLTRIDVPLVWADLRHMEEDVLPRDIHYYLFRRKTL